MWRCLVVAGYRNLAFRKGRVGKKKKKKRKGRVGDVNMGAVSIQMTFKAIGQDELCREIV